MYIQLKEIQVAGGWWGATKVVTHQYPLNQGSICGYYTASEF